MIEIEEDFHFEVGVIKRNTGTLFGTDNEIACPLCLPHFTGRKKIGTITKYSRHEYVLHYQAEHVSAICAVSAYNEYSTHQRIYEAFVLYIVALGELIRSKDEEEPVHPFVTAYTGIADHFESEGLRNIRRAERKGKGIGKRKSTTRRSQTEEENGGVEPEKEKRRTVPESEDSRPTVVIDEEGAARSLWAAIESIKHPNTPVGQEAPGEIEDEIQDEGEVEDVVLESQEEEDVPDSQSHSNPGGSRTRSRRS
jgi:hypothetical protein